MPYAPIVDVEYAKRNMNVEPGKIPDDAVIEDKITEAEYFIREYCNNAYINGLPLSYRRNIVKMVEFDINRKAGYTSEGLSRHSEGFAQEYPADVLLGLKRSLKW